MIFSTKASASIVVIITSKLREHFPVEISLKNDAKSAGLCEKTYGSIKEFDDAIFLCLGTGIGGSVFQNGKMLKPKNSVGFEVGHMIIRKDGEQNFKLSCIEPERNDVRGE